MSEIREERIEVGGEDWLVFYPPEFDKGYSLMDAEESTRYLAMDAWARDKFGDDPRIMLDDGYAPRDRWYRIEHAYRNWVEKHPDDEQDFPGKPPYDLGEQLFLFQ